MTTLTLDQLAKNLAGIGAPSAILTGAMPAVRVIAIGGVREGFQTGRAPDGTPWRPLSRARIEGGSTPLRDKGLLLASITAVVSGNRVELKASHPGANVHQFGATIRPRTAKALAIPLTREAKRIGSPRQNRFPRPLFICKPKGGKSGFLAEGTGDGLVLHYILRRSVTIPARPYLGFSKTTLKKISRIITDRGSNFILEKFGYSGAVTAAKVRSWSV